MQAKNNSLDNLRDSLKNDQKEFGVNRTLEIVIFKGVSRDYALLSASSFSSVTIFTTVTSTSVAFLRSSMEG